MDFEAHRQRMVEHFIMLYDSAAFGPDYARWAVREYIETPHIPWPKIGYDVKETLDARNTLK